MAPRAATAAGHQIQSKPIKVLDSQAPYEGGQNRLQSLGRVGKSRARFLPTRESDQRALPTLHIFRQSHAVSAFILVWLICFIS